MTGLISHHRLILANDYWNHLIQGFAHTQKSVLFTQHKQLFADKVVH